MFFLLFGLAFAAAVFPITLFLSAVYDYVVTVVVLELFWFYWTVTYQIVYLSNRQKQNLVRGRNCVSILKSRT